MFSLFQYSCSCIIRPQTEIPFVNEEQLRDRGTSRTPDVLLSTPLGIEVPKKDGSGTEWKIICWIDSKVSLTCCFLVAFYRFALLFFRSHFIAIIHAKKALFGDVNTHQTSVLPQAESYVHRFGPGLVLYWFGHGPLDRLSDAQGDISILGWDLPESFMLPTGELISSAVKAPKNRVT